MIKAQCQAETGVKKVALPSPIYGATVRYYQGEGSGAAARAGQGKRPNEVIASFAVLSCPRTLGPATKD